MLGFRAVLDMVMSVIHRNLPQPPSLIVLSSLDLKIGKIPHMENHFVKCTQSDYKAQPTLRYDTQCMVLDPFLAGIFVAVVGEVSL